ncbi:pyruvate, phosphate dikinase [Lyticum sinuosum]|uniref:Pyruvate, phosphate dikinase n=1 Tax=Lyticum sinuosum TaxID=1332059 RepID=A0AAE4VKY0_9RICK|nr:pyruvate, phosphate dikinase [Lyticum sinuosum]MDZ5761510.1 Pyruvate, phosphate dikinase [Lyticum sinuosum]
MKHFSDQNSLDRIIFNFSHYSKEITQILNENFNKETVELIVDKKIWGGKGSALITMSCLGIDVPPGFIVNTSLCSYYNSYNSIPSEVENKIKHAIQSLEDTLSLVFGSIDNPLLISVRSGAPISMPGMMDTILNIGLNDEIVEGLSKKYNNPRFAYDSYRRLLHMFGTTVMQIESNLFDLPFDYLKISEGVTSDHHVSVDGLKKLINTYKNIILEQSKEDFPQNVYDQLFRAIKAVLDSWQSKRAIKYREIYNISEDLGTAVTVQAMVFGNLSEKSCTGVIFSRNPSNGDNEIFGEFLLNAQGEDIVSGIKNSLPISIKMEKSWQIINNEDLSISIPESMERLMPDVFVKLKNISKKLEYFYGDMQDIEFTVENGRLWILQSRSGKRSSLASLKIANDMVEEKIINKKQALKIIPIQTFEQLLHCGLDYSFIKIPPLTCGLPASPGAAVGMVATNVKDAELMAKMGKVILVRNETSPEDMSGIAVADGIITARGGMTSHAAVVARGMGKSCICSVSGLFVDGKNIHINGEKFPSGTYLSMDSTKGEIYLGQIPIIASNIPYEFEMINSWINEYKKIDIHANAETIGDIESAFSLGATAIGLCRTEHMFFSPERIFYMRKMILSKDHSDRVFNLDILEKYQQHDFEKIFEISKGKAVTIRLLDPPLHEFLPHDDKEIKEFCIQSNSIESDVKLSLAIKKEHNPMLGHRGCRLAITYPEIYIMQVRAILCAISKLVSERKVSEYELYPEIMIPLVSNVNELAICKKLVQDTFDDFCESLNDNDLKNSLSKISYKFGAMIELPCAALQADRIAEICDFISFGTNDLTQTTLGLSRDDSANFIATYVNKKIWNNDPFVTIEQSTVGELLKIAINKARSSNPKIKIGICGEHAGNPESIPFINSLQIDYISCSPYRIPLARLISSQV